MIIDILTHILRFIFIVAAQVLIVNNIELGNWGKIDLSTYVNPYIYVAFILTMPYNTKPWLMLLLGFACGVVLDSLSDSPGMHMTATTFIAYFRRFYLLLSTSKEEQESNARPSLSQKGFIWFFTYIFILIFIHHFLLFFLEAYSFGEFISTIQRIALSTTFSVFIVLLFELVFYKKSRH